MDMIQQIQQARAKIKDIRATYKWFQDNKRVGTFQWGWKQDKEFFISPDYQHNSLLIHYSIDGEKEYTLIHYKEPTELPDYGGSFEISGSINKLRPHCLLAILRTPMSLLKIDHTFDLAESLAQAETIEVCSETDTIDGVSCRVLEAKNTVIGGLLQSLRVWIDPARDFHMMKLEGYLHKKSKPPFKKQNLYTQIDNITLKESNGCWFPAAGSCQHFHQNMFGNKPDILIRLEVDDIHINQGIDDDEFRIQFPTGCAVHDEFAQNYFVVGEA